MPKSKGYVDLESGKVGGVNAILNEAMGTFFLSLVLLAAPSGGSMGLLAVGGALAFWCFWDEDGQYSPAVTIATMFGKEASRHHAWPHL